jgi:hypothetical protein
MCDIGQEDGSQTPRAEGFEVSGSSFGLMLKTFAGDAVYVERLVESFNQFNVEGLSLWIVAPDSDLPGFRYFASEFIQLVSDEDIPVRYLNEDSADLSLVDPRPGRAPFGFLNQGISKLAFFKLGLLDNYVCLDSDTEFIRPFGRSDFMAHDTTPWFFAQDYSDLAADPFYRPRYWLEREKPLDRVRERLGVEKVPRVTVHNSLVMSSAVLEDFENIFLLREGLDFSDLMQMCTLEFFWYGTWMQRQQLVPLLQRGDLIRMVNHQGEHLSLYASGVRKRDLAEGYLGVIVNSNWSRQYGVVDFDRPPVAEYFRQGDWAEWMAVNQLDSLWCTSGFGSSSLS